MASPSSLRNQIERISAAIFEVPYNATNARTGYHILRRKLAGPRLTSYYPDFKINVHKLNRAWEPIGHELVDYDDQARIIRLTQLKERGKGAPLKGQGKQALKKKKK